MSKPLFCWETLHGLVNNSISMLLRMQMIFIGFTAILTLIAFTSINKMSVQRK